MNKNCNRCGRFRNTQHLCNPIKVMNGNQVAYTFTMNQKKKSLHSSKLISKTSKPKSRLLKGMLVTLVSAALSYNACIAIASVDSISNTVTYQQTAQSISTSTIEVKEPVVVKPETIKEKIQRYSLKYDVDPKEIANIIQCESHSSTTIQSSFTGTLGREQSWGLAQIHITKHEGITKQMAQDPDYAINFLAKHWSLGHREMWMNCSLKYGYI